MTHTGPIPESAGDLKEAIKVDDPCRKCGSKDQHFYRVWESHDGAYEDYKHECRACGHVWWVDGIDS